MTCCCPLIRWKTSKLFHANWFCYFKAEVLNCGKWVSNSDSKSVLTGIPKSDLWLNIREIDLGSQPMPDSKASGLVWDVENDKFRVLKRNLLDISTRPEMLSSLAGQFDPLGILAPCLLEEKLILQNVATLGLGWDNELPEDIVKRWRKWVVLMESLADVSIPSYCFAGGCEFACREGAEYQLHRFCDASNYAFSCVVYLRRLVNGRSCVAFVQAKVKVVLTTQTSWVISRKELEAAKICGALMQAASKALQHLGCSLHFWSDSQVVLKWIINPDLHLPRFVKRRVDMIHLVAPADSWSYVHTSLNPADVGTRVEGVKKAEGHSIWLNGPDFLLTEGTDPRPRTPSVFVQKANIADHPLLNDSQGGLNRIFETSPDLYTLKKRLTYLTLFKQFVMAKVKKVPFVKSKIDASLLHKAFKDAVKFVQRVRFGAAVDLLKNKSPDVFDSIVKKPSDKAANTEDMNRISELKALKNLRPCVDNEEMFCIDGRLENATLAVDAKHS